MLAAHLATPEVSARPPEVVKISLDDLEERARGKTLESRASRQILSQSFPEGPELGDLRVLGCLGHGRDPLDRRLLDLFGDVLKQDAGPLVVRAAAGAEGEHDKDDQGTQRVHLGKPRPGEGSVA
jgi:hypothetical protein